MAQLSHKSSRPSADRSRAVAQRVARTPSRTSLPSRLRAGLEHLSGLSMAGVRVHHSSPEPAKIGALAYTRGTEIHVGPGQSKHLPHEAWHAVQQMQGRVKPTTRCSNGLPLNDNSSLEAEADRMGARALQEGRRLGSGQTD